MFCYLLRISRYKYQVIHPKSVRWLDAHQLLFDVCFTNKLTLQKFPTITFDYCKMKRGVCSTVRLLLCMYTYQTDSENSCTKFLHIITDHQMDLIDCRPWVSWIKIGWDGSHVFTSVDFWWCSSFIVYILEILLFLNYIFLNKVLSFKGDNSSKHNEYRRVMCNWFKSCM